MNDEFGDPADRSEASVSDHPGDHFLEAYCPRCVHPVEAVCPKCKGHVEPAGAGVDVSEKSFLDQTEFYRRLLVLIQGARNSKFTIGCYLIATGHANADGVSMAEYGAEWGVVRATVSKECVRICKVLQIPPSRYMRNEASKENYRNSNRRPNKMP